jgi:hypothetical protein
MPRHDQTKIIRRKAELFDIVKIHRGDGDQRRETPGSVLKPARHRGRRLLELTVRKRLDGLQLARLDKPQA